MSLRNVYLYGDLAKQFGKVHRFDVNSIGEAIRALCVNFPNFKYAIDRDAEYNVVNGKDLATGTALNDETIKLKFKKGDFHIAPAIVGAKAGVLQIVLGAVLFVVGAVLSIYGYGAGVPLMKLGVALMLSGVAVMLTPVPETPKESQDPDENRSFIFDGAINTTEQGGPLQLVYGHMLCGSTVISTSLDVVQVLKEGTC
jgi:predicted phage tail protein